MEEFLSKVAKPGLLNLPFPTDITIKVSDHHSNHYSYGLLILISYTKHMRRKWYRTSPLFGSTSRAPRSSASGSRASASSPSTCRETRTATRSTARFLRAPGRASSPPTTGRSCPTTSSSQRIGPSSFPATIATPTASSRTFTGGLLHVLLHFYIE